ncbi:MAG: fumarylacetoacetate hydrolase family protein [Actinomycetota bacterium]|nr:fumarylacetoacetate hydrolase family protein [Actinomycetota bacterium]
MTTGLLLVQYTAGAAGPVRAGVRHDGVVRALPGDWPDTVLAVLDSWEEWSGELRALELDALRAVPDARLVAPVTFPRKVLCAGANYYSHAREMNTARPDPSAPPFFFMKPPTTTILGPVASVPLPRGDAPDYDWEGELAIVIGRPGKHIAPEDARSHVAGYTVADDLSARGRFSRPNAVFAAFAYDWLGQKAQDGSCPIGPGIAPAWAVPDIEDQRMRLWVNGELKQDTLIGELVVGIAGLVSAASDLVMLEPGDLILTGTPAGVGLPRNTFLAAGDVVEVEIGGIGRIVHTISAPG